MLARFILMAYCMGTMTQALADDCPMAVRLTQEADSRPLPDRLTAYQSARAACPSDPKMHYREGLALMAASRHEEAHAALTEALGGVTRQNASPAMRLEILGRLAENEYRRGNRPQALSGLKIARSFAQNNHLNLPDWLTLIQKDLDKQLDELPLSLAEMKSSLRGMRDLGVEPAVDYRVLFDTDSDTLTPEAEQQLRHVADSLGAGGGKIRIVGHTDLRGTAEHNQKLSEKRALRVATWLAGYNPSLAASLSVLGKGMSEPKYFGDSLDDHQMNRRVEFVFSN